MQSIPATVHQPVIESDKSIEYVIRPITSRKDYQAYFSLRYLVWNQLDYIPPALACHRSRLEVDVADRTATALGMFHKRSGKLIGCGRLVRSFGREIPHPAIELIEILLHQYAKKTGEAQLAANFKRPFDLQHPYDLLKGFAAFKGFYQTLVENHITHAELGRIIVDPIFRHQRFGEQIVEQLLEIARHDGIDVLFMACLTEHQQFYARSNFHPLNGLHCERFANVDIPGVAMARVLDFHVAQKLARYLQPNGSWPEHCQNSG